MLGALLGALALTGLGLGMNAWNTHEQSQKQKDEAAREFERNQQNAALNEQFYQMLNGGASSDELMRFAMDNNEWSQNNNAYLNTIIGDQYRREHYGDEIKAQMDAYKQNGINPNLIYGNVNFGGGNGLAIDSAPQQNAVAESNNGLSFVKDMLLSLVALKKILK